MNDLALQIRFIHHVEVHEADGADTRRREVERQRRTQAACTNAQNFRRLQLLLAFHADLRKDQVAGISGNFFVCELRQSSDVSITAVVLQRGPVANAITLKSEMLRALEITKGEDLDGS